MNPSERAVLKIIRLLALETSSIRHHVSALRARWPHLHTDAYASGFNALIQKGLLSLSRDGQLFDITKLGMQALSSLR
jgi:hypothetical protein